MEGGRSYFKVDGRPIAEEGNIVVDIV